MDDLVYVVVHGNSIRGVFDTMDSAEEYAGQSDKIIESQMNPEKSEEEYRVVVELTRDFDSKEEAESFAERAEGWATSTVGTQMHKRGNVRMEEL